MSDPKDIPDRCQLETLSTYTIQINDDPPTFHVNTRLIEQACEIDHSPSRERTQSDQR